MPRFVVQKHDAIRAGLHYDFRLEKDGVFKSWVIPKLAQQQRCKLAIQVADHSEECAYFEGNYGPGYGEGSIKVWDQGTYELVSENWGKWKIILHGKRLTGNFTLVRKKGSTEHWFLIDITL